MWVVSTNTVGRAWRMYVPQPVISDDKQIIAQMCFSKIWQAHRIQYVIHGKSVTVVINLSQHTNNLHIKLKENHQYLEWQQDVLLQVQGIWDSVIIFISVFYQWVLNDSYLKLFEGQEASKILVTRGNGQNVSIFDINKYDCSAPI